jgi:hypothetical protein
LESFPKAKSRGPDFQTLEFYLGYYDMLEELQRAVEDSRVSKGFLGALNSNLISLIRKKNNLEAFEETGPISLCNYVYRIIAKIIANRVNKVFSNVISQEQFCFLHDRQNVGAAQEGLHYINTKKIPTMVLKLGLVRH